MPTQNFGVFFAPSGAVHLFSLHVLLLHSESSSQNSPPSLPVGPSGFFASWQPGKFGGQSPVSAHCFGGASFGRCGGSATASRFTGTLYGWLRSPPVATGSFAALKPCR